MVLLLVATLAVAWFAVAEVTGWGWAYGVAVAHVAVACMGADSMV